MKATQKICPNNSFFSGIFWRLSVFSFFSGNGSSYKQSDMRRPNPVPTAPRERPAAASKRVACWQRCEGSRVLYFIGET